MKTLLLTIQCVLFLSILFCLLMIFYEPVQTDFLTGSGLLGQCEICLSDDADSEQWV
jgi:hypothetical protein